MPEEFVLQILQLQVSPKTTAGINIINDAKIGKYDSRVVMPIKLHVKLLKSRNLTIVIFYEIGNWTPRYSYGDKEFWFDKTM